MGPGCSHGLQPGLRRWSRTPPPAALSWSLHQLFRTTSRSLPMSSSATAPSPGTFTRAFRFGGVAVAPAWERFTLPLVKILKFNTEGWIIRDRQHMDYARMIGRGWRPIEHYPKVIDERTTRDITRWAASPRQSNARPDRPACRRHRQRSRTSRSHFVDASRRAWLE